MPSTIFTLPFVVFACLALGCAGGQDNESPAANTTSNIETPAPTVETQFQAVRPSKTYSDPRDTVTDFLNAVKTGDDEGATSLLTTAAQEEAWKNGMAISADGFAQARFKVADVEYLNNNQEAHVQSVWSDVTATGEEKTFECLWLLNREPHGWCVYGMATKFLEHLQPVVLNFENQGDMRKKQVWADQQIALHRQQQLEQAGDSQPIRQANRPTSEIAR